jgi:hypothetical protein
VTLGPVLFAAGLGCYSDSATIVRSNAELVKSLIRATFKAAAAENEARRINIICISV